MNMRLRDDGKAASRRAAEASEQVEQIQSAVLLVTGGAGRRSLPHLWFSGIEHRIAKTAWSWRSSKLNFTAGVASSKPVVTNPSIVLLSTLLLFHINCACPKTGA